MSLILVSNVGIAKTLTHNKYTIEEKKVGNITLLLIHNPNNGPVLGMAKDSGLQILEITGQNGDIYAFKDMNGNGKLDPWEDWRLPIDDRSLSFANELTKDEIAGLMLFSDHERNPQEGLTAAQKNTYMKIIYAMY